MLADLGLKRKEGEAICSVFEQQYLGRIEAINNTYEEEDEDGSAGFKVSKKFPLNLSASDLSLSVNNPRIVDIEWQVVHTLNTKNLNKVFQPRFLITLTLLTQQGGSLQQGADSYIQWSSKRNYLKLKRVEFECDQTELTHLLFKVKTATNSLE